MMLPPPPTSLQGLAAQHRLEEVAARFGLTIEFTEEGGRVPFAALAHVHYQGHPLTPNTLKSIVFPFGLSCDDRGIRLAWNHGRRSVDTWEDALLRFCEALLIEDPAAFLKRPERAIHIPRDGSLPRSASYLERFYGKDFVPREKKELVADLARSQGPFMRSVDDDPLQIVDAASQIASLAAGFRPDGVQAALDDGKFDPFLVAAPAPDAPEALPVLEAFRARLREVAPAGLDHVIFVNGGAEANEKALHIARMHGPGGHRVLAFEGSFHGRTLLSLWATWSPAKRVPYQLPGYEATFLPMPVPADPYDDPAWPADWGAAWSDVQGRRAWDLEDSLLQAEVKALQAVEAAILAGDVLGCIIEPYQCEGGDQSGSRRFFMGLRGLTRAHGVPLIFDEVQSGFGLSGDHVFWHQGFRLLDPQGRPDAPDLVTGAKRAQVGYVISRWPDPALTVTHAASVVRGICHLDVISQPGHAERTRRRLADLKAKWGHIISRPRVFGDAFAFDMPDAASAEHLIGQRFYRGYMVYIAGERTLRYRLNRGMRPEEVDAIFGVIDRSLSALVEEAGGEGPQLLQRIASCKPAKWEAPPPAPKATVHLPEAAAILADSTSATADQALRHLGRLGAMDLIRAHEFLAIPMGASPAVVREALGALAPQAYDKFFLNAGVSVARFAADRLATRIRAISLADFEAVAPHIEALQAAVYEPARQDSLNYFRTLVSAEGSVALVAEDEQGLVGLAIGAPVELWPDLDGPRQDAHRGRHDTLYSADTTVAAHARGRGVGERLREAFISAALAARRPDGRPRYAFITGRNQVGGAEGMWALNQRYGAYAVATYAGQYGEPTGMTRYYRLPLRRHDRRAFALPSKPVEHIELGDGLHLPTGLTHPLLERARDLGVFDEPALTKLTISNFITPGFARYSEYLQRVAPRDMGHMYFTSCPDEMVDKSLRSLKHNRKAGRIAVHLAGGYAGNTTAVSRSLSDPGGDTPAHGFFGWPSVPHPADGLDATLAALDALVETHGAEILLGLYVEAVQVHTGKVISPEAWAALCAFRERTGVPLVLSETTTGMGRNGRQFWWVDGQGGGADVLLWWAGGQIGHVFASDRAYVSKPLTLISTWDGDELSATRLLWQLYAIETVSVADRAAELESVLQAAGVQAGGLGLYRTVDLPGRGGEVAATLARHGIRTRWQGDRLLIAPPLTITPDEITRFGQVLWQAVKHV